MFGILRLFLASMVVMYHAGYHPFNYMMGVTAVTDFYILSGFVVSALYSKSFGHLRNAPNFYIERAIRILPQYYYYLILYTIFFVSTEWFARNQHLTLTNLFANITLIPLGLRLYLPDTLHLSSIIMPAHSLATEVIFYLLMPIIIYRFGTLISLLVSLVVFCLASHNIIPIDIHTYWTVPGILIFFLLGHLLYQKNYKLLALSLGVLIANQLHLLMVNQATAEFNKEIYLGVYFGIAMVLILRNFKSNAFDKWCGCLSYGCFLSHIGINQFLGHFQILITYPFANALTLLALSILSGYISYRFVEKKTEHLRRKWRKPIVEKYQPESFSDALAIN